jgi:unsaturated rhamnogalacturonyl hydrolase
VAADTLPTKSEIVATMRMVSDFFIGETPDPGDNLWSRSTYFTGNMAMYATWPDHDYHDYALLWAESNGWGLNGGTSTRYAGDHCAGQAYIDLYEIDPSPERISDITTSIYNMVDSPQVDDWWWIDAFYMAMPVFTRLGNIHDDSDYHDKMYALYDDAKTRRGLYDATAGLWYEDETFKPPETTPNGKPIFWSRGNGWVFAALAKTLEHLPVTDPHRAGYLATFQEMAAALMDVQRADGFWNVSLADTLDWEGPETSGTAFFTFGIAWGINKGYLDDATYRPVVTRAWNGMTQIAVHDTGKLGFVQGAADSPAGGQPVTYDKTADFAVGAFLLAGSEVCELAGGDPPPAPREVAANLALDNVIAYSGQQTGREASCAVDDSLWTRWSANGFPQWIELDLGTANSIRVTELAPYRGRAYQFKVETKVGAGDPYGLLVDRLTNTSSGMAFVDTFHPVQARFVRLTVTGAHDYTGSWVSIPEFKLYGDPNEPPVAIQTKARVLALYQNHPNPFNPSTTISFTLPKQSVTKLMVYNVEGRLVRKLVDGMLDEGFKKVIWDGKDAKGNFMSSGVYFYRLKAGNRTLTKKMVLLK